MSTAALFITAQGANNCDGQQRMSGEAESSPSLERKTIPPKKEGHSDTRARVPPTRIHIQTCAHLCKAYTHTHTHTRACTSHNMCTHACTHTQGCPDWQGSWHTCDLSARLWARSHCCASGATCNISSASSLLKNLLPVSLLEMLGHLPLDMLTLGNFPVVLQQLNVHREGRPLGHFHHLRTQDHDPRSLFWERTECGFSSDWHGPPPTPWLSQQWAPQEPTRAQCGSWNTSTCGG